MNYDIPILFLVFNRPDVTKKVLLKIRKQKPKKLYVVADGPRKGNETDVIKCKEVRELIEKYVDWDCIFKKTYRVTNLGCKKSVESGITWFFKNEEMGVILEDDCLPINSFFSFCEKLLHYHKNDTKIISISGNTFISDKIRKKYINEDYFYSKYPHIWGWATWRRAWNLYDGEWINYKKKSNRVIMSKSDTLIEFLYWKRQFNFANKGKLNTWDYPFMYCSYKHNLLSIQPKYNLVKNIGFSDKATHTRSEIKLNVAKPVVIYKYNNNIIRNKIVDKHISKQNNIYFIGLFKILYNKIFK